MKLALPICSNDLHLAVPLLRRIVGWRELLKDLKLVVVAQWADQFDVQPLAAQLATVFANSEYRVIPDVPEALGWPDAANHMFYQTAQLLAGEAFYWMEADSFPLRPCFIEDLEKEYEAAGRKYMGVVTPTRYDQPDGSQIEEGRHMVGTGIYPKDFLTVCKAIHFVPRGVSFDIWIEKEIVPECHHTLQIAHRFSTAKYILDNGVLNCVDYKERGKKPSNAKPVPIEVAVIHGSKDLSLYDIDFSSY